MPPHVILVADDSQLSLKVIKRYLTQLIPEHTVLVTSHPRVVIDLCEENDIKMVFTDLIFFDTSSKVAHLQLQGIELITVIRQMEVDSMQEPIPIIAISGDISKKNASLQAGASAFLPKPFKVDDIKRILVTFEII